VVPEKICISSLRTAVEGQERVPELMARPLAPISILCGVILFSRRIEDADLDPARRMRQPRGLRSTIYNPLSVETIPTRTHTARN
jgi:hypothetical protein